MFDFLKRKKEPYVQSSTADWQDQWRSLVPPECRNVTCASTSSGQAIT